MDYSSGYKYLKTDQTNSIIKKSADLGTLILNPSAMGTQTN